MRIIIIGAGVAGLAAANELANSGNEVVILEARNYIGGRIHTDYSFGIPIDLGASWLHGIEGNPIAQIAKELNLNLLESNFLNVFFINKSHQQISLQSLQIFKENNFGEYLLQASNEAKHYQEDVSLWQILQKILPLSHEKNYQELLEWALTAVSFYTGTEVENLSAKHWDEEKVLAGGHFFLQSTYQSIINHLARYCKIELNSPVKKIVRSADKIEVFTEGKIWQADKVIVTVPLGVLQNKSIQFSPILPKEKQTVIDKLGMGLFLKVILKFPMEFWPKDFVNYFFYPFEKKHIRYFFNLSRYVDGPFLMGIAAGKHAESIENLSDREIINQITQDLRLYFGGRIPEPISYLVTRWGKDPYSCGAYSYLPPGATGEDHDSLAMPIDNQLYFAGEATSRDYFSTVHGAYLSGIREAKRILN